jgi:hypothetical protein
MYASLSLADLIARATTLYTNARDNAEIADALADPYGYGPDDYAEGLARVEAASTLDAAQDREYREKTQATAEAQAATSALEGLYVAHRRLARTKIRRDDPAYAALGLRGKLPDGRADLIKHADDFYRTLDDDPTPVAEVRGMNAAALERGRTLVQAARDAMTAQAKETGEAERATATRDDAVEALRAHAAELAEVAKIALADRPQLLEVLGISSR